jgi:hypothetical protein
MIRQEIEEVNQNPALLQRVMNNSRQRLQETVRRCGEHLRAVIFKPWCISINGTVSIIFCVIFILITVIQTSEQRAKIRQVQLPDPVLLLLLL